MKKRLIIYLALLGIPHIPYAQNDTLRQLSTFIENTLETSEIIPSVSVAMVTKDKVVYQGTFGYAHWEQQTPATHQSNYYIASCTKLFNGLLAHILANEGKIDLNAPILGYGPFKDFERKEVFKGITVMDLISHQSGIDNPYLSFRLAYSGDYSEEDILRLIEGESQKNEEGKAFAYTNYGYYLFDYLLRAELGKSWKDLLQEKVFEPLGMAHTTAYISEVPKERMAFPHHGIFKGGVKVVPLQKTDEVMHAAGGLLTNVEDAAAFLQFYLAKGKAIYPQELVVNTVTPQVAAKHEYVRVFEGKAYASGWRVGVFEGEKVVYHFGGYPGYFAHFSFLPEKNMGMAILVNNDMGMTTANLIAKYAYNLYLGNTKEVKKAEKIRTKKIPKALAIERKAQLAHQKKLAERSWNLSLPKEKYAGVFHSEKYGTVEIRYQNNTFTVSAGNLKTTATAFPSKDTMRVELVPGSGTIIGYDVNEGEVVALYHQKEAFVKME